MRQHSNQHNNPRNSEDSSSAAAAAAAVGSNAAATGVNTTLMTMMMAAATTTTPMTMADPTPTVTMTTLTTTRAPSTPLSAVPLQPPLHSLSAGDQRRGPLNPEFSTNQQSLPSHPHHHQHFQNNGIPQSSPGWIASLMNPSSATTWSSTTPSTPSNMRYVGTPDSDLHFNQQLQMLDQRANPFLQSHQQHQFAPSAINPFPSVGTESESHVIPSQLPFPPTLTSAISATAAGVSSAVDETRRWSCEYCRKRKRKCDGVRPHCGRCVKDGRAWSCTFLGFKEKVDPVLAEQNRAAIEAARLKTQGAFVVDPAWLATPDTLETMIVRTSLTSATPCFSDTLLEGKPSPAVSTRLPARPGADPSEQEILAEACFNRSSSFIQIVHRKTYLASRKQLPALLQAAVCAMGASDPTLKALPKQVLLYYYAFARARALEWSESPSLECLQALLLLAQLSFHLGKTSAARMLFGFACRLIELLRIDVDPDDLPFPLTPIEKEVRRRCWYACYLCERFTSVSSNRPEYLTNRTDSVKAMCPDDVWLSLDPLAGMKILPQPSSPHIDAFLSVLDIHLDVIKACTAKSAFAPSAETKERNKLKCQDNLNDWFLSLPPHLSVDTDVVLQRLLEMVPIEASNLETTTLRWEIALLFTYHVSRLLLAVPSLNRHLPTVLSNRMAMVGGGHKTGPISISSADAAELASAFESAWSSTHSVCSLAAGVYSGTAIVFPNFALIPLFVCTSFLALAETMYSFWPPLIQSPTAVNDTRRARMDAGLEGLPASVAAHGETEHGDNRKSLAAKLLRQLAAMFESRLAERPAFGGMLAQLRSTATWASSTPSLAFQSSPSSLPQQPLPPPPAPSSSSLSSPAPAAFFPTPHTAAGTPPSATAAANPPAELARPSKAPVSTLEDAVANWSDSADLKQDFLGAPFVALHRLALVTRSFELAADPAAAAATADDHGDGDGSDNYAAAATTAAASATRANDESWHALDGLLAELLGQADPAAAAAVGNSNPASAAATAAGDVLAVASTSGAGLGLAD
ncbi:fungal-specific transcription factor domain-containing protein [Zopfochytrium polystomum]|nr:fungal-specific transcription factor domain-containing protein [Zopfochytrium polystomum]